MELVIYTYGYGELMYNILNAIAMIMNHKGFLAIVKGLAAISVTISAISWVAGRSFGLSQRPLIIAIISLYFVLNGLLAPKLSLTVQDRVTKQKEVIDNLPFLFLPVAWLEKVGDWGAGVLEQAMTPVRVLNKHDYRHYGLAFGAQMKREAKNWRIHSPEFARNMHGFLDRCVKHKAAKGNKYTVNDLHSSANAWELVRKNSGGISRVDFLISGKYKNLSCKEAAIVIEERYFPAEYESLIGRYASSLFARASNAEPNSRPYDKELAQRTFASNVETVFAGFKDAGKAKDIITQQMMLAAISHQNTFSKYGLATIKAAQDTAWGFAAIIGADTLPILFNLFKSLLYASAVLLVPMMLMPGGLKYYKVFLLSICSLQLWPSLYAVLNIVTEMYSSSSIFGPDNGILNYTSYSDIGRSSDRIAAIAGFMQLSIPVIAYQLINASAGGLISLSGQVLSSAPTASAAEEVTKGRVNVGNVSVDTMQRATQSAFKTDLDRSVSSGSSYMSHMDGTLEHVTAAGGMVLTGGMGRTSSSGDVSFRSEDGIQGALNQHYNQSKILAESDNRSYQQSEAHTSSKAASYLKTIAEHQKSGKGINIDTTTEEGRAISQALDDVDAISKDSKYTWEQNAEAYLSGNVSASTPGKLLGFGATVEAGGKVSAGNSSSQSAGNENRLSSSGSTSESHNNLMRALSSGNWLKEKNLDQSMSTDVRKAYEQTQKLEKQYNARLEDVDTYDKALQYSRTHSATSSKDMYQDVLENHARRSGKSLTDARKDLENRTPEVMQLFNELAGKEANNIVGQIRTSKASRLDNGQDTLNDFTDSHQGKVSRTVEAPIRRAAIKDGFNSNATRTNIEADGQHYAKQFNSMYENNNQYYEKVKGTNTLAQDKMQQQLNQHEKNRIGKSGWSGLGRKESLEKESATNLNIPPMHNRRDKE